MVDLQVITNPWKLMNLEPVMKQVPVYWSRRNDTTRRLESATLGHYDCYRNLARQKKTDNEKSRKSGIQRKPSS